MVLFYVSNSFKKIPCETRASQKTNYAASYHRNVSALLLFVLDGHGWPVFIIRFSSSAYESDLLHGLFKLIEIKLIVLLPSNYLPICSFKVFG